MLVWFAWILPIALYSLKEKLLHHLQYLRYLKGKMFHVYICMWVCLCFFVYVHFQSHCNYVKYYKLHFTYEEMKIVKLTKVHSAPHPTGEKDPALSSFLTAECLFFLPQHSKNGIITFTKVEMKLIVLFSCFWKNHSCQRMTVFVVCTISVQHLHK